MSFVAACLTYWPAINHNFTNCDDDLYVSENSQVQNGLTWDAFKCAFTANVAANRHPVTLRCF